MRENFPSSLFKARPKNTILQDGQIHPKFRIRYNNCVCVCKNTITRGYTSNIQ